MEEQNNANTSNYGYVRRVHPAASADRFKLFGVATLIYAIICALCLYENWSSIWTALLSIVSVFFISSGIVRSEKNTAVKGGKELTTGEALIRQYKLIPYYILIVLLSIAVGLTDDSMMIFCCNIGVILVETYAVMSYYNDTRKYGIVKGIIAFLEILCGAVGYVNMPFMDRRLEREQSGKTRNSKLVYVLIGCAIALPILVIVLNLLSSADPIFAKVIKDIFGKLLFSWDVIMITVFAIVIYFYLYAFITKAGRRDLGATAPKEGTYEPVIGITITVVLTAFYLIFVFVQIVYLFMSSAGLPEGMTYAEYARQGFFQLLFVAVVNVCIVVLCNTLFRKNLALKVVLFIMCICTYVMIASSAVRLSMYIKEYNLSYLRINTIWALIVTSIIMAGVMIGLFSDRIPLFRFMFVTVISLLAVYALIRPGSVIARYNLNPAHAQCGVDLRYIVDIGNDGIPYVIDYLESKDVSSSDIIYDVYGKYGDSTNDDYYYYDNVTTVGEVLDEIVEKNDEKGYVRGFNFSRYRATKMIREYVR